MALTAKKVYAILSGKIAEVSGDVSSLGTALFCTGFVLVFDNSVSIVFGNAPTSEAV